jgi:hypothetical protein
MPYRSLPDPEIQGEVSIDPLGLMPAADNLADWLFPRADGPSALTFNKRPS